VFTVLILNGGALPTLLKWRERHPAAPDHLGRLARPRHISRLRDTLDAGLKVGVDCEAFVGFDQAKFLAQLIRIEQALYGRVLRHSERIAPLGWEIPGGLPMLPLLPAWHRNLLFVVVPDVPFDAEGTARLWAQWTPWMSHLPLALCVQDGAEKIGIPWGWPNLRCLFMAGSDDYKESIEMAAICREGKRRGLHIHAGRVNSRRRIDYLLGLDFVDSIDGTGFDQWRDAHLGWGLDRVSGTYAHQGVLL
jgi:hypothetical protein